MVMWYTERGKASMEATRGGGLAGPRVCGMIGTAPHRPTRTLGTP